MSKITLTNVGSLIDSTTAQTTINNNNAVIQTAFDNTLSRDGTSPNTMSAPIDMNGNRIINLGAPVSNTDAVRFVDISVNSNPAVGTLGIQNANAVTITGGTIAGTAITGSTINGVTPGTIFGQNANAVAITGGTITGTNLGSMALQNSNNVTITGGSITGTNLTSGTINPDTYGADPTGVNPSDVAITAALAANVGKVISMTSGGTYKLTGSVKMQPNTRVTGNGCTFIQGAGANLTILFDFSTNVASGSQLDGCIIDGNSSNNTNNGTALVNVSGGASNVTIANNVVKNSTNGGISIDGSQYANVRDNTVSNCPGYGISVIGRVSGFLAYAKVKNNNVVGPYFHAIQITQASIVDIDGNVCEAVDAIGDTSAPLRVNISGSAMSWVSGPTFANAKAGTIVVFSGGSEAVIANVNSTTSITLTTSPGTFSNVLAAIGSGDIISVINSSYVRVSNNETRGGVTGGVVVANSGGAFPSTDSTLGISIVGNVIGQAGQLGIATEAFTATGSPVVNDVVICSNTVINPGRIAGAGGGALGIQVYSVTGLSTNITITGNVLHDYSSIAGGYWLGKSGSAGATNVVVGTASNAVAGFANGQTANGY